MAILPNSRPSTGWRRGYLTNELHKRDFRCRRTKTQVFQNCNDKIVMTTPWSSTPRDTATTPKDMRHQEQCSRHKTIGTIPRYPRDPKTFLVKFEKRRVKTLRQDASPERRRD